MDDALQDATYATALLRVHGASDVVVTVKDRPPTLNGLPLFFVASRENVIQGHKIDAGLHQSQRHNSLSTHTLGHEEGLRKRILILHYLTIWCN